MAGPKRALRLRSDFGADDDVSVLLTTRWSTADEYLAQYLIARVSPDAYAPRPGQPASRCSEQKARQVLAFLARRMNRTTSSSSRP